MNSDAFYVDEIKELICVHMYTASKRVKLEIPSCSGFKVGKSASKPDQPELSSSIRLEAVYI